MKEHKTEFECVGSYADAESAIKKIPEVKPDVVLMDINLPGLNGIECLKQVKAKMPELDVIMLTVFADDQTVFHSLCAGACGYITKNASPKNYGCYQRCKRWWCSYEWKNCQDGCSSFNAPTSPSAQLTDREREVLDQLCRGKVWIGFTT